MTTLDHTGLMTGLMLHVGCGDKRLPGYAHVDARPGEGIDYTADLASLPDVVGRQVASLIYACHVLEHFRRARVPQVLKSLHDTLIPGGTLRLSVPDFRVLTELYLGGSGLDIILGSLYGGQDYAHNFHFMAFDSMSLSRLLTSAGFQDVHYWDPEKVLPQGYSDYASYRILGRPISLNLEAVKP